MAKTKIEKIAGIEEEIRQLENKRRQLVQAQKAQERKDRTKRLCKRMGLFESLLPESISLTDEQFQIFLEKTVLTEQSRRILDGLTARRVADGDADERTAQERLAAISPEARQVLLLTTLEGFSHAEAAAITGRSAAEVGRLVAEAVAELDRQTATQVLIIEDEPLISLDLSEIVESLGHGVTTIARTADQAVAGARANPPGLVLADIQLADGSSGLDAVREILEQFEVPVIFVTSFPERLLTGQRPEPAFLITKPYDPNAVKATISQALFFRTAASLAA